MRLNLPPLSSTGISGKFMALLAFRLLIQQSIAFDRSRRRHLSSSPLSLPNIEPGMMVCLKLTDAAASLFQSNTDAPVIFA
jgi:hypothetical protein